MLHVLTRNKKKRKRKLKILDIYIDINGCHRHLQ